MTILEWLQESMIKLRDAGVDSPRRDCLVLIEDLLEKDRAWVLAHHEYEPSQKHLRTLNQQLNRRIKREPLAYIRGKAWFYGRFFDVTPDVMIPRPESEAFIELLKQFGEGKRIIDVGTGSGCLAVTAKLELPDSEVIAIDSEENALKIARHNAKKHGVEIKFVKGDLLEPFLSSHLSGYSLIANLPYVPKGLITSPEIKHEPSTSLFSGQDGLDHYRNLWKQVEIMSRKPQQILTESLYEQHKSLRELAETSDYHEIKKVGLIQLFTKA